MKQLWAASQQQCKALSGEVLPQLNAASAGAVKVSTGLGLPLCRGFAQASGGWLGLVDDASDSMTHLWCVLEVTQLFSQQHQHPASALSQDCSLIDVASEEKQSSAECALPAISSQYVPWSVEMKT